MSTTSRIRSLSMLALAASLFGCGQSTTTLRGKVSDQNGTQQQGLSDTGGLGGSGTVSAATEVRVMQIGSDGSLTQIQGSETAQVTASGEYTLHFPGGDHVIIQALDAQGQVVASGVVENAQADGQTHAAAPLDTETSVEASVLVQMVRRGSSLAQADAVDLRARINAQVAAAVKSSSNPDAKIQALADAMISAQRTEEQSYQQAGLTINQTALFEAETSAAAELSASLDRGDNATTAYATFFSQLQGARAAAGITEQQQAKAEQCSSSAFRATLEARLQASVSADPVIDAAVRQSAAMEAAASSAAVTATLNAAGAAQASVDAAAAASATLRAAVSASTSASTTATAWLAYQAAIEGNGSVSGSVLGNYLGVNATTAITANAALSASATAAATLDATLNSTFEGALSATGTVNFNGMATSVVNAYATYEAAVRAQATTLAVFGAKATPAMDVMVLASGSISAN